MARKALLDATQCAQVRTLYEAGSRAIELAKQFGVSESSLYKVLDGSYQARPANPEARVFVERRRQRHVLPVVKAERPMGITPSLFADTANRLQQEVHPSLQQMLAHACNLHHEMKFDDLTVAAAEVIVARAKLERVLAHTH